MNSANVQRMFTDRASRFQGGVSKQPTRLTITKVDGEWRDATFKRLEELVQLPVGWDGYDGLPVNLANAYFALQMLDTVCRTNTPTPQIVPMSDGGLQIEWHTLNEDIEIQVRGPYEVSAWHSTEHGDDVDAMQLTNDFLPIASWISEMTEPEIALRVAA
jgi:hypothetical protein